MWTWGIVAVSKPFFQVHLIFVPSGTRVTLFGLSGSFIRTVSGPTAGI